MSNAIFRLRPKKVLVCGGRNYTDRQAVERVLSALHDAFGISEVIHGAANGADTLAHYWAHDHEVKVITFPADWKSHGPSAGPKRNRLMAEYGPDLVVAFPGGVGTLNMIVTAREFKIDLIQIKHERKISV